MKAAICYEFGKPLVIEEVEIDPPKRGEVKVRLTATGICHSDVHLIRGEWGGNPPIIAGHEAAGIVEEIGTDVVLTKPGDAVVVSLLRSCGHCFHCTIGSPHLCEGTFALNTESRLRNRHGETLQHGLRTAAFADYVIVDESQVAPISAEMPLDRAALLACGVITGIGAVVNTAHVRPGQSVVVIGTGGVGLNAIQGAVLVGAHPIIAVDLLETKLTTAQAFGATHTINVTQQEPLAAMKELTLGRGTDYVFVTVGSPTAVAQGFDMISKAGTVVVVGLPHAGATVPVPIGKLVGDERRIIGCLMGSTRLRVDIPRLVELYRHKRLKLDELITARYPLERINEAIMAMETGEVIRNMIVFSQSS